MPRHKHLCRNVIHTVAVLISVTWKPFMVWSSKYLDLKWNSGVMEFMALTKAIVLMKLRVGMLLGLNTLEWRDWTLDLLIHIKMDNAIFELFFNWKSFRNTDTCLMQLKLPWWWCWLFWDGSVPLCRGLECNVDCVYANPKANKLLISLKDSTFLS